MLDYHYFKDHYQLTAIDLSKKNELDADPRAIQQIEFYGMLKTNSQMCTVNYIRILQMMCLQILQSAVKNKLGRMNAKVFSANNLPHEWLLTTRTKN